MRRLHARFDNLHWMKLSEVSRYWAARELTRIERKGNAVTFKAPFACPEFTLRVASAPPKPPEYRAGETIAPLVEVDKPLKLSPGNWCREGEGMIVCLPLAKGVSQLALNP